jgi:UDP-N-acetylglucosamine 4,6-dehydratase
VDGRTGVPDRTADKGWAAQMTRVLITGGSGSFGQAFTRFLLTTKVERVIIYSRGEHAQEEMQRKFRDDRLRFFIGDVRDQQRLRLAMRDINTVIHAAALKIVPTAEYNPTECIATNVRGAENVVMEAIGCGVSRVIALSTDKAVNPINLYGASKLAAEKIFVAANNLSAGGCRFSVVRYGNVAGSRGSVLPLFLDLINQGETRLPVTDDRMTRFWITMKQAIELVNTCHRGMGGREIFVPKIPSIRIVDLALALVRNYRIVGIRPGEKLHEVLVTEDESRFTREMEDHYIIYPPDFDYIDFSRNASFRYASDTNPDFLNVDQIKDMFHEIYDKPSDPKDHGNPAMEQQVLDGFAEAGHDSRTGQGQEDYDKDHPQ